MKIAITGGIGSGKSAVTAIIGEYFPVYSCDAIYRDIRNEEGYLSSLVAVFGSEAVKEGKLNKKFISDLVFKDESQRKKLDDLSHPLIMKRLFAEMDKHEISFAEVPLLFEGGYEDLFDEVIVVLRPIDERIEGVMVRDGVTMDEVKERILSQIDHNEKIKNGYTVITNDGSMEELKNKVVTYLKKYLR